MILLEIPLLNQLQLLTSVAKGLIQKVISDPKRWLRWGFIQEINKKASKMGHQEAC